MTTVNTVNNTGPVPGPPGGPPPPTNQNTTTVAQGATLTTTTTTTHSPPVELPSSNAKNFFEEAKTTKEEKAELQRRFLRFAVEVDSKLVAPNVIGVSGQQGNQNGGDLNNNETDNVGNGGAIVNNKSSDSSSVSNTNTKQSSQTTLVLTLDGFVKLLQHYEACPVLYYEPYFFAGDRNRDGYLCFTEFLYMTVAADPSTVHILNSFTGFQRSLYIFDFYDLNRSGTLEFSEFARLVGDTVGVGGSGKTKIMIILLEIVIRWELGDHCQVRIKLVITILINMDYTLSTPGLAPPPEQTRRLAIDKARELGALEDAGSLLHFTCIKFRKFYELVHSERLRGTSRLFRFYKSVLKPRSSSSKAKNNVANGTGSQQNQQQSNIITNTNLSSNAVPTSSPPPLPVPDSLEELLNTKAFLLELETELQLYNGGPESDNNVMEELELDDADDDDETNNDNNKMDIESESDTFLSPMKEGDISAVSKAQNNSNLKSSQSQSTNTMIKLVPYESHPLPCAIQNMRLNSINGGETVNRLALQIVNQLLISPNAQILNSSDSDHFQLLTSNNSANTSSSSENQSQTSQVFNTSRLEDFLNGVLNSFQQSDQNQNQNSSSLILSLSLNLPTKIFGSIHGQLQDLLTYFRHFGAPLKNNTALGDLSYTQYVFLGDYVDRGHRNNQLETVMLLFALKILYPQNVFLLRGRHENRHINGQQTLPQSKNNNNITVPAAAAATNFSLRNECDRRFGGSNVQQTSKTANRIFELINQCFDHMPLAALLSTETILTGSTTSNPSQSQNSTNVNHPDHSFLLLPTGLPIETMSMGNSNNSNSTVIKTFLKDLSSLKKPLMVPHPEQQSGQTQIQQSSQSIQGTNTEKMLLEMFYPKLQNSTQANTSINNTGTQQTQSDLEDKEESITAQFCNQHKIVSVIRGTKVSRTGVWVSGVKQKAFQQLQNTSNSSPNLSKLGRLITVCSCVDLMQYYNQQNQMQYQQPKINEGAILHLIANPQQQQVPGSITMKIRRITSSVNKNLFKLFSQNKPIEIRKKDLETLKISKEKRWKFNTKNNATVTGPVTQTQSQVRELTPDRVIKSSFNSSHIQSDQKNQNQDNQNHINQISLSDQQFPLWAKSMRLSLTFSGPQNEVSVFPDERPARLAYNSIEELMLMTMSNYQQSNQNQLSLNQTNGPPMSNQIQNQTYYNYWGESLSGNLNTNTDINATSLSDNLGPITNSGTNSTAMPGMVQQSRVRGMSNR